MAILFTIQAFDPNREKSNFVSLLKFRILKQFENAIRVNVGTISLSQKAWHQGKGPLALHPPAPGSSEDDFDENSLFENVPDEGWNDHMIESFEFQSLVLQIESFLCLLAPLEELTIRCYFGLKDTEPMTIKGMAKDWHRDHRTISSALTSGIIQLHKWLCDGESHEEFSWTPPRRKRTKYGLA
ncbi:MAG: hypothetical protein EOP09_08465 [Proteobacteria bacterium]|nr:MAG: hypothetical protein EOP09_08465 [Pseudomonadota bacterium]